MMAKERDISIDLLKTIGIVAVVAFHCNLMGGVMNLFHNPLFMFSAGMFHPRVINSTWGGYFGYLKKRFFRIYLPFVLLTAFLTLIQPLLVKLQLLGDAPYTLSDMPMKLLTVLAMRVEGFSGPCWFLISLLEISITFETIRLFTHRLAPKTELAILLVISIVLFPIGIYTDLPRVMDESATLFIWYVLGFIARPGLKKLQAWQTGCSAKGKRMWLTGLCAACVGLFPCMVYFADRGYAWGRGAILPLVFLGTALGILWSFSLANLMKCLPFVSLLALPGKCSFTIMAWHLGAFRLLSLLRVLVLSASREEALDSVHRYDGTWAIIYCLWGVLLPTFGKICWDTAVQAIRRKPFSL